MSQKKVAIGIDLGTTKCCVGVVREGQVEILENERSSKTTPSYVAFTDTERLVGEDAKDQATLNPANTVFRVKRIMGRDLEDLKGTKASTEMPYSIVDEAGDTCINVTYKRKEETFLPQQVTAMLLTKMKELAQNRLGCPVDEAVISVPSSFSNAQRQATKDAATIAGLKVLALINEPTAAAIAYQAKRKGKDEETIAVVDFGGGKLDVAIVSLNSASVSVKGLSGTNDFGGNDVDEILMAHVQEKFREKFTQDPPNGVTVLERLRSACVKMKNSLSLLPRVQDQLDCFGDEFLLPISIYRMKYEELIYNRIQSGLRIHLDRALKISGLSKLAISRVVLVGGSTRIPLVPDEIHGYFDGSNLDRSVNPDEAIAQGAAIYAALLSGDNTVTELTVNDMLPNSFCWATEGCSDMQVIFCNLVTIPTIKKLTVSEKVRCLKLELYEELSGRKNPYRLIGTLCLSDEFNKSVRLVSEVVFEIDQCGIFDVMIQLGPSGDPSYIFRDVVNNYSVRLNAESLQNCAARELQLRQDEKEEKDRVEAYTNLESCCFRLQDAMETTNGNQHFPDLVEQIKTEAGQTIDWLDAEVNVSKSDCRTKLKSLKKLELNLKEDLCRLEKLEKERAAAENALRSLFAKVQTFLTNTNVSDEEEKADIVRWQLGLVDEWFKLETDPSKADCDEKRVALNNVVSTLERALEVRRLEKEREASVIDLQAYCRELVASVNNKPIFEADLQLLMASSDQAKDTLQWLESNDKLASKEECIKRRNSLEEKIKTLQCRAEQREQERAAAELDKEREKLVTLWNRCHGLCAKVESSDIGIRDSALSNTISDQVDAVLALRRNMAKNMSKTECDEALALISNLEGLFSTWVKDHDEKVELAKANRREMEQVDGSKRQENEQAEADKKLGKEQAKKVEKEQVDDAKKVEKEQVDSDKKRNKEQAEADKKRIKEKAEVAKRQEKEHAKTDKKVAKEQGEADRKQKMEQVDFAKRIEKEKSCTANKLEKERTDALQSFENKWTSLEATLSMDVLKDVEPVLVNQAIQCAEQTSSWLKVPESFCPHEYKKRLETLKKLGQDLQSRDQQLKANNADADCSDSDIVMIDAESESETEHDKSRCNLM